MRRRNLHYQTRKDTMMIDIEKAKLYKETIKNICTDLEKNEVPYITLPCCGGWVIKFPWCKGDIAINRLTLGNEFGAVETAGFPWDDNEDGCFLHTPEEAAERVINFYKEVTKS